MWLVAYLGMYIQYISAERCTFLKALVICIDAFLAEILKQFSEHVHMRLSVLGTG